ncbi:hypothetical protein HOD05_03525 [Candidatus Woesearchaeota archaeon]|jgi:hypothetical protein|nr:hypothetical protein [Candidatus Woesearchaeota archaeon]MBT4150623.1 hypothetical protein [Candidatus Woesearchaeota archaeon]MBT4247841.1 hypothetical protein [Candidatus Woesearchaeota archaeon]MBT4434265.1 hypothetical protein [Candidatus Woesearchaeota archaeon]MBT7331814.1 hypothetical protein [Candidatus Woesearchaeota archaeon]
MTNYRHEAGIETIDQKLDPLKLALNYESAKSSIVELLPSQGLIIKTKERTLSSTIYEAFSTIFFSELLKEYNRLLQGDFTLYSPQSTHFGYGNKGDNKSRTSVLTQFFCPGNALNKVDRSRRKDYQIKDDEVRVENRTMYLTGIMSEILKREGIIHGDPQLRHFFLLPNEVLLTYHKEGQCGHVPSKNGLGVIDVEGTRVLDSEAEDVKRDQDLFKTRVFRKFDVVPESSRYFELGTNFVNQECGDLRVAGHVYQLARNLFSKRFSNCVEEVDMKNKKIKFK